MAKEKETKQVQEDNFVITEIPTQTAPVIQSTKEPIIVYNELTALCKLMNDVEKIKEGIIGSK